MFISLYLSETEKNTVTSILTFAVFFQLFKGKGCEINLLYKYNQQNSFNKVFHVG